jgi:hypothetical protein
MATHLSGKTCYFTFGRFNPPTTGHWENFDAVKKAAGSNDYRIYISQKVTKNGTDPLPPDIKFHYMKLIFPEHRGKIFSGPTGATPILQELMLAGYDEIVYMVGSDQVNSFSWLDKRNGIDWSFRKFEIRSSGKRDPDGDTFAISGTKMRRAAFAGDFKTFRSGIPKALSDADCRKLMNEIVSRLPKTFK